MNTRMLCVAKNVLNNITTNLVSNSTLSVRTFRDGLPRCSVPFCKSMNNPIRFTIFYILSGIVGFGAPWLVVMHQMLRPYDYVVD